MTAASGKKRVLVLCTGNSCRSQMAEGVLRRYGSERYEVHSAGTKPSTVNPTAIAVMREIGIDLSSHRSKHVDEFAGQTFDYVVTVCDSARETCPVFRAGRLLHWPFPDPPHAGPATPETVDEFRRVRDLILARFRRAASAEDFDS